MHSRSPLRFWTMVQLGAAALAVWGVALLLLVDVDRLAAHW
jgi:hypothetical protein